MSRFDHLDGRTPVVVGAAEVVHRARDGFEPSSATGLMLEAVSDALASSGAAAALGPLVGEVLVPHGTWPEPDPGRAIAAAIGALDPAALPVVTKRALMNRFDDWVTDPALDLAGVAGSMKYQASASERRM